MNKDANKNLKDVKDNFGIVIKDSNLSLSYTKTNKLITALYMVTDIIEKNEPIRYKLRVLGTEIISDMNFNPSDSCKKIDQIMSFLDIASAINIISEMNANILKKEFLELNHSIKESTDKVEILNRQINLSEFFSSDSSRTREDLSRTEIISKGHSNSIGHQISTRVGIQKGSTLLKALSDKNLITSISNSNLSFKNRIESFGILKNKRREEVVNAIKLIGEGATIKDIKHKIETISNSSSGAQMQEGLALSEKTLQRELISMIKDNVLKKTGEKRWSRYFIKEPLHFD